MKLSHPIAPCLWFNDQAEAAASYYTEVFPDSHVGHITRYSEVGREFHGKEPGSVLTVEFSLAGQPFTALNGGPVFSLSEAVSFQVYCDDQAEIDYYWHALSDGGQEHSCGWTRDRFGLSWQVVPYSMLDMMKQGTDEQMARMMTVLFTMSKLDKAQLDAAFYGR